MSARTQLTDRDLVVNFSPPWTLEDHRLFIQTKALPEMRLTYDNDGNWPPQESYTITAPARFAGVLGLEAPALRNHMQPLSAYLFDYQQWIVKMAVEAKRFAIWADCGLGKSPMQLEWARQVMHITGGKVLIMAPPEVCRQMVKEAVKFYPGDASMALRLLESREALDAWCQEPGSGLAITNYEKLIPGVCDSMRYLAGLACDESSILKSGGGKIKWNLIKSAKGIEYKLSCTATPAPNDVMEYASQASFLEKLRTEGEILWTFFHRNPKTQQWIVKPHAKEGFFKFMASWSIYLRKPSAYGFADPFADVPEPEIIEVKLNATRAQSEEAQKFLRSYDPDSLIPQDRLGVTERTKLAQIARGFIYEKQGSKTVSRYIYSLKPFQVEQLIEGALKDGEQCLVWTTFDEEAHIISSLLPPGAPVAILTGATKESERVRILEAFAAGEIRCLISKAQMLGYGMNFQFCTRMIFSGFDDSFERFYQAVRRCYRYGSRAQLKVYVPYVPGLENHIWENVLRKKGQWEADTAQQEANYRTALDSSLDRRKAA
ncbi:Helicase conserved C-terminal domain-containing protein [Prosthecobacter debontii]|uniref:Helicase conserved C-terminal domain-containing protein n=1 Tax=Prosthecobacter debontii TaxID=48467 RepID=A0A1T4X4Z8_9BACT|nr:helicase-related protein [Prosthecobacter debontii]SKA84694.1 Helicase conserved C-terminal domain-containing protein [Prosthecobacter debontii]